LFCMQVREVMFWMTALRFSVSGQIQGWWQSPGDEIVLLVWFENQLMPDLKNPSLVVLDKCKLSQC
jgi:hypothetical protein